MSCPSLAIVPNTEGNQTLTKQALKLLERIKQADATHWSQPSNSLAIRIHDMEREFETLTGCKCPEWPHRELKGSYNG